ncbi:Nucleotidylyl transferase [Mycena amicta]|nr:Nucleotidylyl transferase [Mycena amicta]
MALSRGFSPIAAAALLNNVQRGLSPLEFVYIPHQRWPLPRKIHRGRLKLHISILDSSFNPPTLAHLALANTPRHDPDGHAYDAKIFLLSVRNADKTLASTDASYLQRLEMMFLLAKDTVPKNHRHPIAIGVIDEPTFVGKASKLRVALEKRVATLGIQRPQLNFLMGFDTLERLFAPHYYGDSPTDPDAETKMFAALDKFFSEEEDNARVIYARRGVSPSEEATLALAERYVAQRRIELVEIKAEVETCSSTQVRRAIEQKSLTWRKMVTLNMHEYLRKEKIYLDSE